MTQQTEQLARQLRECSCGTLTNDERCPDCGSAAFPLWTVHATDGRRVGYVAGCSERDACDSIEQSPEFDRYLALQPHPCFNTPEQGPLP